MEETPTTSPTSEMTPPHEIHIRGIIPGTNELDLSDGGFSEVNSNQPVFWILDANPDVESIIAIFPKTDANNVFEKGPGWANRPDRFRRWRGLIMKVDVPTDEEYTILYRKFSDREVYEYDPTIRANP